MFIIINVIHILTIEKHKYFRYVEFYPFILILTKLHNYSPIFSFSDFPHTVSQQPVFCDFYLLPP